MLQCVMFPSHIVLQRSYLKNVSNSNIQGFWDHARKVYLFAVRAIGYAYIRIINLFLYLVLYVTNQTLLGVIKMYCVIEFFNFQDKNQLFFFVRFCNDSNSEDPNNIQYISVFPSHSRHYCLGAYRVKTDHTGVWRM